MKRKLFLVIVSVLITVAIDAQLVVDNTAPYNSPTYLVNNVLLGTGVQAFNITFSGDATQIGYFDATNTLNMPIQRGLIMSSGDINVALGPNNSSGNTLPIGGFNNPGDGDLNSIATATTNDAAVLEFDFVPVGDTVRFGYSFASEEYLEYVFAGYNDAFGFFLSGPNITGPYSNNSVNIALIPSTTTPVTIDNVNSTINPTYYLDNGDGSTAPYNTNSQYIQFDGMTVRLEAVYQVQCGDTYHIKLAIADAGDAILDSGVFLEAESFSSEGVEVNVTTVTGDSTVFEGCTGAQFTFSRPDTLDSMTVFFDIGGNAINGTDYITIGDSVFFPVGEDSVNLLVIPIIDTLNEGTDTLILTVYTVTPCGDTIVDQGWVFIMDNYTIETSAPDTTLSCPMDSIQISATANYGVPPFIYLWSTGAVGQTIYVPALQEDTFLVTVTDSCMISMTVDTVIVSLSINPPVLTLSNDTLICPGDPVTLTASGSGGAGSYQYTWSTGATTASIQVNPSSTTDYYVSMTDACGTYTIVDTVQVNVNPPPISTQTTDTTLYCPGDPAGIVVSTSGGTPSFSYQWSTGGTLPGITVSPMATATYYVTVSDQCSQQTTDSVTVNVPQYPPIQNLTTGKNILCAGDQTFIIGNAAGGTSSGYSYSWNWSGGPYAGDTLLASPQTTTNYLVQVTDDCGYTDTVTIQVVVPIYDVLSTTPVDSVSICPGDPVMVATTPTGGAGNYSYAWFASGDIQNNDDGTALIMPNIPGSYAVTVTDQCGESVADDGYINMEDCAVIPPNVFTPNGDGVNDKLFFIALDKHPNSKLVLYNRWGKKVYENEDYQNDWTGGNLSDGVYYYVLSLNNGDVLKGYIHILTH